MRKGWASDVADETDHFPIWWVLYPPSFILAAMPVMLRGMAAKPDTGSLGFEILGAAFSTLT